MYVSARRRPHQTIFQNKTFHPIPSEEFTELGIQFCISHDFLQIHFTHKITPRYFFFRPPSAPTTPTQCVSCNMRPECGRGGTRSNTIASTPILPMYPTADSLGGLQAFSGVSRCTARIFRCQPDNRVIFAKIGMFIPGILLTPLRSVSFMYFDRRRYCLPLTASHLMPNSQTSTRWAVQFDSRSISSNLS